MKSKIKNINNAKIGIILGSGQSGIKKLIKINKIVSFKDLPGFDNTTVKGHEGEIVLGHIDGTNVICSLGRFHYYEGISIGSVSRIVNFFHELGIEKLIICNSSGCLKKEWNIGDVMYINGCIDYSYISHIQPEIIFNDELHKNNTDNLINNISTDLNINVRIGPYVWVTGPSYETPSEILDMIELGGGAVGMSTFPEIRSAIALGIDVYGLALLTNYGSGITPNKLTHKEVVNNANYNIDKLENIIYKLTRSLRKELNE